MFVPPARNPSNEAIDNMIKKIFNIEIYSDQAQCMLKRTKSSFSDFWNKYNDHIIKLVDDYKNIRYFIIYIYIVFFIDLMRFLILKFYFIV